MGERPVGYSIDRIDVNGNYCKENCRWADRETQNNNKRNNVKITYKNETKTVTQWAKQLGIEFKTLQRRIERGWSLEDALTLPGTVLPLEIEYNNKILNQKEYAKANGINVETLRKRVERGWSLEEAATKPLIKSSWETGKRENRLITAFGKTQSLANWVSETGLGHKTISNRLDKHGWSPEEALSPIGEKKKRGVSKRFITFKGETHSLVEWANLVGVSRKTLSLRIDKYGWTIEAALSTPPRKKKEDSLE